MGGAESWRDDSSRRVVIAAIPLGVVGTVVALFLGASFGQRIALAAVSTVVLLSFAAELRMRWLRPRQRSWLIVIGVTALGCIGFATFGPLSGPAAAAVCASVLDPRSPVVWLRTVSIALLIAALVALVVAYVVERLEAAVAASQAEVARRDAAEAEGERARAIAHRAQKLEAIGRRDAGPPGERAARAARAPLSPRRDRGCSGYVGEELARRGIAEGRYVHLRKPFGPEALIHAVAAALAQHAPKVGRGAADEPSDAGRDLAS